MHETIQAWDETTDPSDSPVSDFLGIMNQKIGKELEQEKQELKRIFAKLKEYFSHNFEVCEDISEAMKNGGKIEGDRLTVVDVFAIDSIYMRLNAYNWKHIPPQSIDVVEKIIVFVPCPFLFARRFGFSSHEIYTESLVGELPREPVFIRVSSVKICG